MANKKIPMRKCVGCQEMKEKKSLIRVVKTAEGDIILDDTGKKNGRGAYICKSLECFKKAKKTKALERSLGVSVSEQKQFVFLYRTAAHKHIYGALRIY